MNILSPQIVDNYNYYPTTMIQLCRISYENHLLIREKVDNSNLNQTVVWGPARLADEFDVTYSLMYVTYNQESESYTVVIRGTNPISLSSWLNEDLKVAQAVSLNTLMSVPEEFSEAKLCECTFKGLTDLLKLKYKKLNLIDFFKTVDYQYIFVTGHSLGGTLVSPLYMYLNSELFRGLYTNSMACWAFAGLTPGNVTFANYFNTRISDGFLWRIHNPLDVAGYLFCDNEETTVHNLYENESPPLSWNSAGIVLQLLVDKLFKDAYPNHYAQPAGLQLLSSNYLLCSKWGDEAMAQHHCSNYVGLVNAFYPYNQ